MYRQAALALLVLVLTAGAPAEAAVLTDPGYQAGDLGFEVGLSFFVPGGAALEATWSPSELFTATLDLETEEGTITYVDLGGTSYLRHVWLDYGLSKSGNASFLRAGSGFMLGGEPLSFILVGDLFYGRENAFGSLRGGVGLSPWPDSFIMAGFYADAEHVFSSRINSITNPALYIHGRADAMVGPFTLGASATIIGQIEYNVDLYAFYDAWDWGGIGASAAFNAGATGKDWAARYGMTVRARL